MGVKGKGACHIRQFRAAEAAIPVRNAQLRVYLLHVTGDAKQFQKVNVKLALRS